MAEQKWQIVAIIIAAIITAVASLLGPSVAVIVKARIDQPKPAPKTNQPTPESQREKEPLTFRRFVKLIWKTSLVGWLVSLPSGIIMIRALQSHSPVTPRSVLIVSLAVAVYVVIQYWSFTSGVRIGRDSNRPS